MTNTEEPLAPTQPPAARRRPVPRLRPGGGRSLGGSPDGETKAVAVGNRPMLPSQKRLLKAMQRGGEGLTERKPSGPPAPSSWSPEHAILPPVADSDEPSSRSPERQQRKQLDEHLQQSNFVKWQLAQEKQRMGAGLPLHHVADRRPVANTPTRSDDGGEEIDMALPSAARSPPKPEVVAQKLTPPSAPAHTTRLALARRAQHEGAATVLQAWRRGQLGRRQARVRALEMRLHKRDLAAAAALARLRSEIVGVYVAHNPRKVADVDALLAEWAGEEEALLANIKLKYGVASPADMSAEGTLVVASARRLQAAFRGYAVRTSIVQRAAAAVEIQRQARGRMGRRVARVRAEYLRQEHEAAVARDATQLAADLDKAASEKTIRVALREAEADMRQAAVTLIQALFRGRRGRRRAETLRLERAAANGDEEAHGEHSDGGEISPSTRAEMTGAELRASTFASMRDRQLAMQSDAAVVIQRAARRRRDAIMAGVAKAELRREQTRLPSITAQELNERVIQAHLEQIKSVEDSKASALARPAPAMRNWLLNDLDHEETEEVDGPESDAVGELGPERAAQDPGVELPTTSGLQVDLEPEREPGASLAPEPAQDPGVELPTTSGLQVDLEPEREPGASLAPEPAQDPGVELPTTSGLQVDLEPEREPGASLAPEPAQDPGVELPTTSGLQVDLEPEREPGASLAPEPAQDPGVELPTTSGLQVDLEPEREPGASLAPEPAQDPGVELPTTSGLQVDLEPECEPGASLAPEPAQDPGVELPTTSGLQVDLEPEREPGASLAPEPAQDPGVELPTTSGLQVDLEPECEPGASLAPEPELLPEPDKLQTEPEPELERESEPEPKHTPELLVEPQPQHVREPEPQHSPGPEPELEPEHEPERKPTLAESEPAPEREHELDSEFQPESELQIDSQAAAEAGLCGTEHQPDLEPNRVDAATSLQASERGGRERLRSSPPSVTDETANDRDALGMTRQLERAVRTTATPSDSDPAVATANSGSDTTIVDRKSSHPTTVVAASEQEMVLFKTPTKTAVASRIDMPNIAAGDPIMRFLDDLALGRFYNGFVSGLGALNLEDLRGVEDEDLDILGLRKLEKRRFFRAVQELDAVDSVLLMKPVLSLLKDSPPPELSVSFVATQQKSPVASEAQAPVAKLQETSDLGSEAKEPVLATANHEPDASTVEPASVPTFAAERVAQLEPDPAPEVEPAAESTVQSESEIESDPQAEPQPHSLPNPKPDLEPEPLVVEADPEPAPQTDMEPGTLELDAELVPSLADKKTESSAEKEPQIEVVAGAVQTPASAQHQRRVSGADVDQISTRLAIAEAMIADMDALHTGPDSESDRQTTPPVVEVQRMVAPAPVVSSAGPSTGICSDSTVGSRPLPSGPKTAERTRTLDDLHRQIEAAEVAAGVQVESERSESVSSTPSREQLAATCAPAPLNSVSVQTQDLQRPQAAEQNDWPARSTSPTDVLTFEEFAELAVEVQGVLDEDALRSQFREIGGSSGGITLKALSAHSAERDAARLARAGSRDQITSTESDTDETEETTHFIGPDDWAQWEAEQQVAYHDPESVSAAAAEFEGQLESTQQQQMTQNKNRSRGTSKTTRIVGASNVKHSSTGITDSAKSTPPRSLNPTSMHERATTPDSIRRIRNWVDWGHPATPTTKSRSPGLLPPQDGDEIATHQDGSREGSGRPSTPSKSILNWPPPLPGKGDDPKRTKPYPTIELPSLSADTVGYASMPDSTNKTGTAGIIPSIMRPLSGLRPSTGRTGISGSMVSFDDEPPVQWDFAPSESVAQSTSLGSPDCSGAAAGQQKQLYAAQGNSSLQASSPTLIRRSNGAHGDNEMMVMDQKPDSRGTGKTNGAGTHRTQKQQAEQQHRRRGSMRRRDRRAGSTAGSGRVAPAGNRQSSATGFKHLEPVGKETTCSPDTVSASSFLDTLSSATASPGGGVGLRVPQWMKGALNANEQLQYRDGEPQQRGRRHRRAKAVPVAGAGSRAHVAPLLGKSPLAATLSRSSGRNNALRSLSPQRRRTRSTHRQSPERVVRESRSAGDLMTRANVESSALQQGSNRRQRQRAGRNRDAGAHQDSSTRKHVGL